MDGGMKKVAVPTQTPTATPTVTAPLPGTEKEPQMQEWCEEAVFLETAKDYFNEFKEIPAQKHWTCLKNYFNQKCGSVFGKQKVEPVVKNETPEVVAKPAGAAVESR